MRNGLQLRFTHYVLFPLRQSPVKSDDALSSGGWVDGVGFIGGGGFAAARFADNPTRFAL
jgi:hypothetical protein